MPPACSTAAASSRRNVGEVSSAEPAASAAGAGTDPRHSPHGWKHGGVDIGADHLGDRRYCAGGDGDGRADPVLGAAAVDAGRHRGVVRAVHRRARADPRVVLLGFLPPLLYATAIRTSVIDFRANRRSIGYLSVLLVVVTALGVGLITWLILPVPLRRGLRARRRGGPAGRGRGHLDRPPGRACRGSSSRSWRASPWSTTRPRSPACGWRSGGHRRRRLGRRGRPAGFLIAAVGGVAGRLRWWPLVVVPIRRADHPAGLRHRHLVAWCRSRPTCRPRRSATSEFHGSGVIAVVVAGLILGHKSPVIQTGQSRLSERVNWAHHPVPAGEHGLPADRSAGPPDHRPRWATRSCPARRIAGFCVAVLLGVIVHPAGLGRRWPGSSCSDGRRHRESYTPPWGTRPGDRLGRAARRGHAGHGIADPGRTRRPGGAGLRPRWWSTAGTLLLQGLTLPCAGPGARSARTGRPVGRAAGGDGAADREQRRRSSELDDRRTGRRPRRRVELVAIGSPPGRRPCGRPGSPRRRRDTVRGVPPAAAADPAGGTGRGAEDPVQRHDRPRRDGGGAGRFDIEESMLTIATERADAADRGAARADPAAARPAAACHLEQRPGRDRTGGAGICQDCVREGTRTVHLRICLTCGNVGCCDSSVGPARRTALPHHPPPGDAQLRARRVLALVLRRRAVGEAPG